MRLDSRVLLAFSETTEGKTVFFNISTSVTVWKTEYIIFSHANLNWCSTIQCNIIVNRNTTISSTVCVRIIWRHSRGVYNDVCDTVYRRVAFLNSHYPSFILLELLSFGQLYCLNQMNAYTI